MPLFEIDTPTGSSEPAVTTRIYVACSALTSPSRTGAAAIFATDADGVTSLDELVLWLGATSNNRGLLDISIAALETITDRAQPVTIVSTSTYLINGMNDLVSSWSGNEWRNASGDEVANRDLWERLLSRALIGPVSWNVARDRADSRFCEEAKALARSGAYRSTMTDRATGSRALRRY